MRLLLVAATEGEIRPLFEMMSHSQNHFSNATVLLFEGHDVRFLVTGIGGVATACILSAHLVGHTYDLVINIGIAGAFSKELGIGDVVNVTEEIFGDLGIEESDSTFHDLFESGLMTLDQFPFREGKVLPFQPWAVLSLPVVRGLSINKVHGNSESIDRIRSKYDPEVETMEGAAFFYTCHVHKQPGIQLRAISNFVESRNREKWNIPLALENLSKRVFHLLSAEITAGDPGK